LLLHIRIYAHIFACMRMDEQLENESLEFKRQLPTPEKLAREVVALANGRGGKIIIGYDEKTKTYYDQQPNQRQEELIANIFCDYCQPRPNYVISYETQIQVKNKPTLLIIDVFEGEHKPYSIKNKSLEEGVFVRVGSTTRKANRQEIARLLRVGQNISYDHEEVNTEHALDADLLKEFLKIRNQVHAAPVRKITKGVLQDLGLLTKYGKPTVAGILLFSKQPQKIPLFEDAYIKAARFKGLEKGFFIDKKEIYGSIPEQLSSASQFILKNTRTSGKILGAIRQDQLEYPEHIIREIIVNALVHRDYSFSGSSIMISIYDDRIEVSSPGGLEAGITTSNIQDRQYSRNPTIAKRMYEMGYFDSWGQGIDNIVSWSMATSKKPPVFVDENNQFTITVFSSFLEEGTKTTVQDTVLTKREDKIIELLKKQKTASIGELQKILKVTKGQAQSSVNKLLKTNLIFRIGSGKNTQYKLT
jgi:ATP-dependent DNA helicase RecG